MTLTGSPISNGWPPRATSAPVAGSSSRTEPGHRDAADGLPHVRRAICVHVPPTFVALLATNRRWPSYTAPPAIALSVRSPMLPVSACQANAPLSRR